MLLNKKTKRINKFIPPSVFFKSFKSFQSSMHVFCWQLKNLTPIIIFLLSFSLSRSIYPSLSLSRKITPMPRAQKFLIITATRVKMSSNRAHSHTHTLSLSLSLPLSLSPHTHAHQIWRAKFKKASWPHKKKDNRSLSNFCQRNERTTS